MDNIRTGVVVFLSALVGLIVAVQFFDSALTEAHGEGESQTEGPHRHAHCV